MNSSNVQAEYWAEIQSIRTHAYYLAIYQEESEKIERNISIALAVSSSSSIAAWVVWKEYAAVWSVFIALSQVVSVVYKYLPFKSRIKPLSVASIEMSILADEAEKHWHSVSNGTLTAGEINDKRFSLRNKSSKIMSAFSNISLPENNKYFVRAKKKTEDYINGIYKG